MPVTRKNAKDLTFGQSVINMLRPEHSKLSYVHLNCSKLMSVYLTINWKTFYSSKTLDSVVAIAICNVKTAYGTLQQ